MVQQTLAVIAEMAGARPQRPGAGAGKPGVGSRAIPGRQRQIAPFLDIKDKYSIRATRRCWRWLERKLAIAARNYVTRKPRAPIFPLDRLPDCVLPRALSRPYGPRKFLKESAQYSRFTSQDHFHFEPRSGYPSQTLSWPCGTSVDHSHSMITTFYSDGPRSSAHDDWRFYSTGEDS